MSSYIPTGRTSLVAADTASLQVQTEYAYRPYPRITTTVLNQGQVLHKVEKKLDQPISSPEEQARVQDIIGKQHAAVVEAIKDNIPDKQVGDPCPLEVESASTGPIGPASTKADGEPSDMTSELQAPILDRISSVAGVQRVYHLDVDGGFIGRCSDDQFRKEFPKVFKNIQEIMAVFMLSPGTRTRERGIYEVERDRLYFVSAGAECFFVSIRRTDGETVYEKVLKQAIERRTKLRV